MMKCKKKWIVFLVFVLLCQNMLVGCTEEASASADEVAMDMCQLYISNDGSACKESMGLTDQDIQKVQDITWFQFNKTFKDSLSKMHFYKPTEKDARALYKVVRKSLKRVNYAVELGPVTTDDNPTTIVIIKMDSFDINGIVAKAVKKAQDKLGNIQLTEEETATKYVKLYIKYIDELLQETKPRQEQGTVIVYFIKANVVVNGKVKEVWLPKDPEQFGEELINTAYGGLL